MSALREFISESFHDLAQPVTALRVTVELGLCKDADGPVRHSVLLDCLSLIDRLTQELAVLREFVSHDEEPPLDSCDGQSLLQSSVAEMDPVAQSSGIALYLHTEPALLLCHAPTLRRAIFVLLDAMIADAGRNRRISISLRRVENEFLLEIRPGLPQQGLRQKLCWKLLEFAGGRASACYDGGISIIFRECSPQRSPITTDKNLLSSLPPASKNARVKHIS